MEASSDWIWEIDAEGVYTYASPMIRDLLGYEPREVVGKSPFDFMPADEAERVRQMFFELWKERRPWAGLLNVNHHRDGHQVTLETSAVPVFDENGDFRGYRGIDRDVTARIAAEEAVRASEQRFRDLFENAVMGLYRTTPDGRILMANPAILRMTGFSSFEEAAKYNLEEGADSTPPRSHFKTLLEAQGQVTGLESIWTRPDGTQIHVSESARLICDEHGTPLYYDGTVEDITDRKRAEEAYRTLVQGSLQGFVILQDGRMAFANAALGEILGYTVEELLALTPVQVEELIHPDDRALVWGRFQERLAGGAPPPRYEMRMIRSDGETCWAELLANRIVFDGRPAIQTVLADVTSRVRKEMEQRAIATVATSLRAAEDRSEMVSMILDQVESLLKAKGVALAMYDEAAGDVVFESARGEWTEVIGRRTSVTEGLTGQVFETGAIYVNNDVQEAEKLLWPSVLSRTPAIAGVPLIVGKVTIGVLWMGRSGQISQDDTVVLTAIGEMIASALRRLTLNDALQRSHHELTEAYDGTLEGWARALELRDNDTEGHTRRVADMTAQLGRTVGCNHEETIQLRRGALLHDIGKMAIPDRILNKPGPLDDEEWKIMRRHPEYAFDMLSRVAYLRPALDVPYCHHEKWDGSGYPRGLASEEIPFAARIFAVIDVWDALRSDRPYRKAWSTEKAFRHLRKEAGHHFDPRVVGVFLDSFLKPDAGGP